MNGLRQMMEIELAHMQDMLKKLGKQAEELQPDGFLRVSVDKGRVRYYSRCKEGKYVYIPKEKIQLVQSLAQKQYDIKLHKLLLKRSSQFQRILSNYSDTEIDELYEKEHDEKRKHIKPVEKTWKQSYEEWVNEEYEGKAFQEGAAVILTEKGERVRSKSEKILADYFFHQGIEYKYEKPLMLKGVGIIYPDFTFFSKKIGKEIYWEHDGKMDDPVYVRAAIKKINSYTRNGILPGRELIVTYETANVTLDMQCVAKYAQEYL